mmetsp:Transcript_8034/g.24706  ORF Transcript_8034/g.24706 Transcript_8034/m.24706 type:complete len:334 (-) Transcript_8034:22-1023(-)
MHERAALGQRGLLVGRLARARSHLAARRTHQLGRLPRRGVGHHRPARADVFARLEPHAARAAAGCIGGDGGDVRVRAYLAAALLNAAHERVHHRTRAARRVVHRRAGQVALTEDKGHLGGDGAARGHARQHEALEVEHIAQKGVGDAREGHDVAEGALQQRCKRPRREHLGKVLGGGLQRTQVEAQRRGRQRARHAHQRCQQALQPPPLPQRLRAAHAAQLSRVRLAVGRHAELALGQEEEPALVRRHRHLLARQPQHLRQRVGARPVRQPAEEARPAVERVPAALKGVRRAARVRVRLAHDHIQAVLGAGRRAREAADTRADHHHVRLGHLL